MRTFSEVRAFCPRGQLVTLLRAARGSTVTYDRTGVPRDPWLDDARTTVMTLDPAVFAELVRGDLRDARRSRRRWRWFR